jgi:hypothetical protein
MIPEYSTILEEMKADNFDENLKNKIIRLYNSLTGALNEEISNEDLAMEIMNELFNPYGFYKELMIPFSFYRTSLNSLIVSAFDISIKDDFYTVGDLVALTGKSKQFINKEIKLEKIKAIKEAGRWKISREEGNKFISKFIKE